MSLRTPGKGQSCLHWAGPQQVLQMHVVGWKGRAHVIATVPCLPVWLGIEEVQNQLWEPVYLHASPLHTGDANRSPEEWKRLRSYFKAFLESLSSPFQIFRLKRKNAASKHQNHAQSFLWVWLKKGKNESSDWHYTPCSFILSMAFHLNSVLCHAAC